MLDVVEVLKRSFVGCERLSYKGRAILPRAGRNGLSA